MPYNPAVHGPNATSHQKRPRAIDHRAGRRHSDIVSSRVPVVVHVSDLVNRKALSSGWRIDYHMGEFEVYYELLCARNSTGTIKHESKERCVRVLSGKMFVTMGGEVISVNTNQVCVFLPGMEYELASSGDSDVELLVSQSGGYEEGLIHITESSATNSRPLSRHLPSEPTATNARVSPDRAVAAAEQIRAGRTERRVKPVPRRASLPGQVIQGVNPRPVGAAGAGDE